MGTRNQREEYLGMNPEEIIENGATLNQVLDLFNRVFNKEVTIKDSNPEAPFLWWEQFKQEDPLLARCVIKSAAMILADKPVDAVVCLPSSMTWVADHIQPDDFSNARVVQASREPFADSYQIMVRSYTKNTDGSRRAKSQPRQNVPIYVAAEIYGAGRVLVLDDVLAEGYSLVDSARELRHRLRVREVAGVAAVSKNRQFGFEELTKDPNLASVHALVQVVDNDDTRVWTKRWWEQNGE